MNSHSSIFVSPQQHIFYSKVEYDKSDYLLRLVKENNMDTGELEKIKSERRRDEWLMIRKILTDVLPGNDIYYNEFGKPFLTKGNAHISISHSHHMVAIAINHLNDNGVDIQFISDKVVRIKDKFLNKAELQRVVTDPIQLSCYWSSKEALFKVYGKDDAFLKENFEITELSFNGKFGSAHGIIKVNDYQSEHSLKLHLIDNYILAYTVNS